MFSVDFKNIIKSRRNKWNELMGRYAEKHKPNEDIYFTSVSDGENDNFYTKPVCLQGNEANLSGCQSESSPKAEYVHRKRNIDTDLISKNVRQNKKRKVRKSGFKIENYEKVGNKIIRLDITKTHHFGLAKVNAEPKVKIKSPNHKSNCKISTNIRKSVFNTENIDKNAISEKLIKLDITKTPNFSVVSKVNPELKVKGKSKNSRRNCNEDLSNIVNAKEIDINIFRSVINNKDKTVFNNLNIIYEQSNKVDNFLNKSTSSICHINACQDNSLLPIEGCSANTDEKLTTFRSTHKDIVSARDQHNINKSISNLHNRTFLKNATIISTTDTENNIILLDSTGSDEENCIPEMNSHISPQRQIDKNFTNLKDGISTNSFSVCKPACPLVVQKYVSTKTQNKCETNISTSDTENNIILLDSTGSDEENCIPEINSHISPQRQINKNFTNLKDGISTNSFSVCKPACPLVVQKYVSTKTQNKCETNSDSDYDVWDDIFPTKKLRIGILM